VNLEQPAWVFGYGSLIWKQDFPFIDSRPGTIEGWARRFWQGSHDHRGLEHDPGRVVTLVAAPGAHCQGKAFLVESEVFEHLDHREKNGYERVLIDIHFDDGPVPGVVYRAAEDNEAFLGPAPPEQMASQINRCIGPSGSNRDYVLELARALRGMGYEDRHVFEVESWVLHGAG
jgi:cation transport regulator ChaC